MLRSKSRDSLPFHCKFGQKSGRPKSGRNELFSWLGKSRFLDGKGRPPARTRVSFWGWKDGEPSSSLPSLKRRGCQEEARPGSWIMDVRLWSGPRARDVFGSGRMERPGHIVLLAQNPCRHVSCAGAHRGELKTPAGILVERDAAGGNLIDGTRNLIDRLGEVPVVHLDDGFPCLLDPVQYLLVLDLQFGISLCLLSYLLPESVVFPGVGSHVGQDGHLVDVWIVFWIDVFKLRMKRRIAGAGQTGITIIDLDEGITVVEVGVVIISWQPAGGGVGDLVGLGSERLVLDEAPEGFCVAEHLAEAG